VPLKDQIRGRNTIGGMNTGKTIRKKERDDPHPDPKAALSAVHPHKNQLKGGKKEGGFSDGINGGDAKRVKDFK